MKPGDERAARSVRWLLRNSLLLNFNFLDGHVWIHCCGLLQNEIGSTKRQMSKKYGGKHNQEMNARRAQETGFIT